MLTLAIVDNWVQLLANIAVIIGVITIPFAVCQLRQNGKLLKFQTESLRHESDVAQANFLLGFLKDYSNQEMLNSLKSLKKCPETYGDGNYLSSKWAKKWHKKFLNDDAQAIQDDNARRHVKFYYYSAYTLFDASLITEKVFKLACDNAGRNLLYDYVVPMELEINPKEKNEFIEEIKRKLGRYDERITR